jgi:hypothetical protein
MARLEKLKVDSDTAEQSVIHLKRMLEFEKDKNREFSESKNECEHENEMLRESNVILECNLAILAR